MTLLEAAATTLMSKVASAIEEGRARATEQTEPLGAPPTTKSEEVVDVTTVKDITENVTADVAEDEIPAPVDAAPSNEPQEAVSVPNDAARVAARLETRRCIVVGARRHSGC